MNSDCGLRIAEWRLGRDWPSFSRDLTDRRNPRAAFTLFEILLVLVLLVVMGSLAAPLLHSSFSTIRLQRGTQHVLAAWTSARTKAVETGRVFQFRFIPKTGQYRVEPWSESSEIQETPAEENELLIPVEECLSEGIELVNAEQRTGDQQSGYKAESLRDGTSGKWSAPILFFPDGTTSTASLLLCNQHNQHQRATLRALTGIGRASKVLTKKQVDTTQ